MNLSLEAIHAAAKTLAGFNGEAWQFEPPRMDGVTRTGTHASVYFRQAEEVLGAAREAELHARELGNPVSDTK